MRWARDLWCEPNEDRVSHSRILALVAFLVVSWVIVKQVLAGMSVSSELLLGYLGIMVIGETSKGVSRHRRDIEMRKWTDRGMNDY